LSGLDTDQGKIVNSSDAIDFYQPIPRPLLCSNGSVDQRIGLFLEDQGLSGDVNNRKKTGVKTWLIKKKFTAFGLRGSETFPREER